MYLKPRLAALAAAVPEGATVADVGTGHGLLPVYLVQNGIAAKVIAVENRPGILAGARKAVYLFNLQYKIELRLGNGLDPIRQEDLVDTVVIAGLGGRTICRILQEAHSKWGWFRELILQPMQDTPLLRRWLVAHEFRFVSERLVSERNRIYEIMVVQKGKQQVTDPLLYELGPCLVQERDPLLVPFIKRKLARCQLIAGALKNSQRPESIRKRTYYIHKQARLKEVLALVDNSKASC